MSWYNPISWFTPRCDLCGRSCSKITCVACGDKVERGREHCQNCNGTGHVWYCYGCKRVQR